MTPTPQWLVPAFVRSAKAVGATAPPEAIDAVASGLLDSWASPDRRFHAVKHLVDVLASIDQLAEETHDADVVRIAGWYHGAEFASDRRASYAHKGGEDPRAGAERARRELPVLGIPTDVVERVASMVEQVHRHSAATNDVDAQALNDADLAGLAAEPQKYAEYRKNIRAEYAHIPVEDYLQGRIAILRKISARPRIFCSPMGTQWEEPARQNIAAELAVLEGELERHEATDHDPDADALAAEAQAARDLEETRRAALRELSPGARDDDESTTTLGRIPRYRPRA